MRWNRRAQSNHALNCAVELANDLNLPVLAAEELTCDYPYASDRLHTFALEGVPELAKGLAKLGIGYTFHLNAERGQPGVFDGLAAGAAAIVTDDHPLNGPDLETEQAAYSVDSSCVVPARLIGKRCYAAYSLRPRIHKLLPAYLKPVPELRARVRFRDSLPAFATEVRTGEIQGLLPDCEIDHWVAPSVSFRGGRSEAERALDRFLDARLRRYARDKNEPAAHATSELSPYLHAGCISPLEVALAVREHSREEKTASEEFLEELIVRRELAFNFALYARDPQDFAELPEWARNTLKAHAGDPRDPFYSPERLKRGETHDDLWNASQKELLLRGKIHGYYRIYWGKKILEWSAGPEEALATMCNLNDRYALDGQDPNSYANILWCLGLHDRPWRQRPIFGTVRYMSREGMERKTDVKAYLREIEYLERTGKELAA
jgi:deoxyribodipyrimidine photo-lyase